MSVPHIWRTQDPESPVCLHLCLSKVGAEQVHLLHHGLLNCTGHIQCDDMGPIDHNTERGAICFDPLCVLYGLSFPE